MAKQWRMNKSITIHDLRKSLGMNQQEFGVAIDIKSKGLVSLIENGKASPTVSQALKIEALSIQDGAARIDAAQLNDDVRSARAACPGQCGLLLAGQMATGGASDRAADVEGAGHKNRDTAMMPRHIGGKSGGITAPNKDLRA